MKEIKFRAYLKDEKRFVDIISINFARQMILFYDKLYKMYRCRKFKDFELMQFTGLKDINRKEIYEGDILKINDKYIRKVAYCGVCTSYILMYYEDNDWGFGGYLHECSSFVNNDKIEVIGNIYENKELLGE